MSDFTDADKIHACLGDYWYSVYYSNEQVGNYIASVCFNREQWDYQFKDTKDCLSRKTVPVYETVKVKPLVLLQSEFVEQNKLYARYNGMYAYNGAIKFDVPVDSMTKVSIPDEIKSVGYAANKLIDPTYKQSVEIVDGDIELHTNPFNDTRFSKENVYDKDGNVTDKKTTIWLFDVSLDKEDIYYQYGYIFNIKFNSSERYRDIINVLYDSLINGPSERTLKLYLSYITGIPVALSDNETVLDKDPVTVVTDKNTYEIHCRDNIIVNVGDVLKVGDSLTDSLLFYDFKNIDDSIKAVSLDKHFIGTCANAIVFENADLPVTVTTVNNYTKLDLPITATDSDKEIFNDAVFNNGIVNNVKVDDTTSSDVLASI